MRNKKFPRFRLIINGRETRKNTRFFSFLFYVCGKVKDVGSYLQERKREAPPIFSFFSSLYNIYHALWKHFFFLCGISTVSRWMDAKVQIKCSFRLEHCWISVVFVLLQLPPPLFLLPGAWGQMGRRWKKRIIPTTKGGREGFKSGGKENKK